MLIFLVKKLFKILFVCSFVRLFGWRITTRFSIRSAAIILLSRKGFVSKGSYKKIRCVVLTVASRHDGRNRSRCFAVIGGFAIAPQLFKPVQPVIYMQMHEPNCVSFGGPSLASFGETVRACAFSH